VGRTGWLGWCVALAATATAGAARADEPTTTTRPNHLRLDAGFGAPTGIFGFSVGRTVAAPWAVELGGGLGASGVQIALLGRWQRPLGRSTLQSWFVSAGPSVSLIGEPIGVHVPAAEGVSVDGDEIYYIVGGNLEIGWELRGGWGGLLRVAVGGFLRVAETMSPLCPEGASSEEGSGCFSGHLPSGPDVARIPAYPYFTFGYGWSF
jgi:hypothetical protein